MDQSAWPVAQWGLTDDELKRMKEEIRLHPPMAITVSSGEITQITPIYQDRAIDILRAIIEDGLDPYITNDYAVTYCYFCIEDSPKHKPDCPYILAQQLLNEIDNYGRTETEIP